MPSGAMRHDVTDRRDRLEQEFLRRALGALPHSATASARFVWFVDEGADSPGPDLQSITISPGGALPRLMRSGPPSLDDAVRAHNVDVLLTRLDASQPRVSVPRVLFTLDMLFAPEPAKDAAMPPPLPKRIRTACAEAKGILCPSVYVHKTCAARLEMGLEKAAVARAGVDPVFETPRSTIIDGQFALFILNRYTRAAVPTVVEAIKRNPALFPPSLVVLGPIYPEEPEDWGLPLIRIEQCPDAMTAALMQHAEMCLYLAKGEGSGMRVLEAMRASAMLITTKSGAIFELAGTAPFYCEPDNPISLLQVLRRMLDESPGERVKRRQMGRSLVLDCTWERCGMKLLSTAKRSLLKS